MGVLASQPRCCNIQGCVSPFSILDVKLQQRGAWQGRWRAEGGWQGGEAIAATACRRELDVSRWNKTGSGGRSRGRKETCPFREPPGCCKEGRGKAGALHATRWLQRCPRGM